MPKITNQSFEAIFNCGMSPPYITTNAATPIYRFVSFFDLYDILVKQRLRFSKLATMPDRNEGMGVILRGQEDLFFRQAFIDRTRISKIHDYALENHYVSCWTTEPDLMAMWSLYSSDASSIRISTTVEKLFGALTSILGDMHWLRYLDEAGTKKPIAWHCDLEPVQYADYVEVRDTIRNNYKSFREHAAQASKSNPDYYQSENGFQKDWIEFHKTKVINHSGLFLKDKAYTHEKEVRACLYCGVRNEMTAAEFRETNDMMKDLFGDAAPGELADYIYAKIDSAFLDSICFDPRMPSFKRQVLQELLADTLPEVTESRCFGYLLNQVDLSSDFDGNPVPTPSF